MRIALMAIAFLGAAAHASAQDGPQDRAEDGYEISPALWCASDAEAAFRSGAEAGFRADMPDFRTDAQMYAWFAARDIIIPSPQEVWETRSRRNPLCLHEAAPAFAESDPSRALEMFLYAQFLTGYVYEACAWDRREVDFAFYAETMALKLQTHYGLVDLIGDQELSRDGQSFGRAMRAITHILDGGYQVDLAAVCGGSERVGDVGAGRRNLARLLNTSMR